MAEKKKKGQSFLDKVREIDEAERKAEMEEEARLEAERLRKEEAARKAYEEKLKREKLELLKIKQGGESEIIKEEVKEEKHYSIWQKIATQWYCNKIFIIGGVLCAALVIFLVYDVLSSEKADISIFFIATDYNMETYASNAKEQWADYCPDVNGDGKQIAKVYYVPANYESSDYTSMSYAQTDRTKIFAEFQSGSVIIFIADKQALSDLGVYDSTVFADCTELFPDDEYAEVIGYRLAGTDFAEMIGYEDLADEELYVCFRIPKKTMGNSEASMQENYDIAVQFWRDFLVDHRIDGLTLSQTAEPVVEEEDEEYADE